MFSFSSSDLFSLSSVFAVASEATAEAEALLQVWAPLSGSSLAAALKAQARWDDSVQVRGVLWPCSLATGAGCGLSNEIHRSPIAIALYSR